MKINTLPLAISLCNFIIINLLISVFSIPTQAQTLPSRINNVNSTINGLSSPNSSDRFFKEGRENFKEEIEFIMNNNFDSDLLDIDDELLREKEENHPSQDMKIDNNSTP